MKTPIDFDRCLRAMEQIRVQGLPTGRFGAISDAIAAIQADGAKALATRYIGVKNYAGFGDQREDHEYGYGPKHGYIVFRIERADRQMKAVLGPDHVYLLECVRDFGSKNLGTDRDRRDLNLCELLLERKARCAEVERLSRFLIGGEVESHEQTTQEKTA